MRENINKKVNSNMVIDDGTVEEHLYNKFGEVIGTFRFRPTDIDIFNRYDEFVDKLGDILKPLEKIGINPDGSAVKDDEVDSLSLLNKVREELFKAFNYIFNSDSAAQAFFGNIHPFSIVNGSFYCEQALEVLGNYISKSFEVEVKKVDKKFDRYTQGYHGQRTGKHRNGGKKGSK